MDRGIRVLVFCGSNAVSLPYHQAAERVGTALAAHGAGLVYGAGDRGLMGSVARAVKAGGGYTLGVNPRRFHASGKHRLDNDEYILVDTIQERKQVMIARADACMVLPGGIGTLDELMDVFTLRQLGFWNKPIGLLNTGGFYDGLLAFLDYMIREGFLKPGDKDALLVDDDPERLVCAVLGMVQDK
ncbi:MAG: TIGR00730 family Rossman fold protein [Treponema sp.]|jgi:uncharacterized protein (TIGR00730 family)|nr:TIGR00730 family Rossman fold protein [Treponema sp.]